MNDILAQLTRSDKWYLGGAPGLLYAPAAPLWLDAPGFWDPAHYLHFPVRTFTFALVDLQQEGSPVVPLRALPERTWRPDRLEVRWEAPGLSVTEVRVCGPDDVLSSTITVRNLEQRPRTLNLLAWTAQPWLGSDEEEAGTDAGSLFVRRRVTGLRDTELPLSLALALRPARSLSIDLSEPGHELPSLQYTPYLETLDSDGLSNRIHTGGATRSGLLWAAIETRLELAAGSLAEAVVAAGIATETERALSLARSAAASSPAADSERAWQAYFAGVPHFTCSDRHLETGYWYRWYGLRLNRIDPRSGRYRHPAVVEGIDYFRVPIAYSAQCHLLETRWLHDPELAWGCLMNFVDNQREDGSFPGHIHHDFVAPEGIYHADWGTRTLDVHEVHPDDRRLAEVYPALKRYAEYFYRERDPQGSGLYDHVNQWESGQEYMSRYVWVDDEGDQWRALNRRLKGLDASVYHYRLERALADISRRLGIGEEAMWQERAARTRAAILALCWDEGAQAFMDVSPELERSGLVFALSFYPFFTDIAGSEHLGSIDRWLLNPHEFWTPYPVPASPRSDPHYSPTPHWKGKRTNCPWNGRTWPMTNSHVAEALAHTAETLRPDLRERTADFIHRFVKMLFFYGDPARPNSFEHYHPESGHPSIYRGIDDYMHSWVVDLIVKYVVGVRPHARGVTIDPFPFGLERFALEDIRVRGRRFDIHWHRPGFRVSLDGEEIHASDEIRALEVAL